MDRVPRLKYLETLQEISNRVKDEILIDLDDLASWEAAQDPDLSISDPESLTNAILKNTQHYVEVFSRAVDQALPPSAREITFKDDVLDVIMTQRQKRNEIMSEQSQEGAAEQQPILFPAALTRRYTLYFKPPTIAEGLQKPLAVRQVRGDHLGSLITVRGIATRTSDVKPSCLVNAYTCDRCGCEIFQPVTTRQFTPMSECPSADCKTNQSKGSLFMSSRASKFLPFQELKIQEQSDQVPVGHIPRMMTVSVAGPLTRSISPGDIVDISGIFLPTPYTGFQAIKAGLLTDTHLSAHHVRHHKTSYSSSDPEPLPPGTLRLMQQHHATGRMYESLAKSIAPEIFGHLDVKKALLLLLVGGVTKTMRDGMRIRGDINVCLMGDPGVAKSQLLKYITKVAPRAIYTTGRGSSGVGLTAAVMRDPVTDEMVLEGGALVLADNGIACIDEFDKMDDGDRTAIHEVMEQQTISISKAGITTTLNARASILAAANPLYGRYNPRISPVENINLPAALLSRFDILFLILDTPSREHDEQLARHVTHVHMHSSHPEATAHAAKLAAAAASNHPSSRRLNPGTDGKGPQQEQGTESLETFTPAQVRAYVSHARTFRPTVSKRVADYMVGAYVRMRQHSSRVERDAESASARTTTPGSRAANAPSKNFGHTTPRTLLGILRMSQALARLRLSNEVLTDDVDESLRLTEVSKASLSEVGRAGGARAEADMTLSSRIYHLIRGMAEMGSGREGRRGGREELEGGEGVKGSSRWELDMRRVREKVLGKGFTNEQLVQCVDEYALLDVSFIFLLALSAGINRMAC